MATVDTSGSSYKAPTNPFAPTYIGQCTWFAFGRVKELSKISIPYRGNAGTWYGSASASKKCKPGAPPSGVSVACWSGGKDGYGHVGVVDFYDDTTGSMDFSDCNRVSALTTELITQTSEAGIRRLMGSSYTFLGYIKP